jgi:hypothetical protein
MPVAAAQKNGLPGLGNAYPLPHVMQEFSCVQQLV